MQNWYAIENEPDVPSPALLVYPDRIRANLSRMIRWAGNADQLRPHVKTHKMPAIVRMKLESGITKFKASTIAEAEMTGAAGGRDVLLAYQPVGPAVGRLIRLVQAFPETVFSTIVDNMESAKEIDQTAQASRVRVKTLVDLDVGMHRTGIAPGLSAAELYRFIAESSGLEAAGFHAYDGHLHDTDETILRSQAAEAFAPVWKLREKLESEGYIVPAVIGCGTPTSKFMAHEHDIEVSTGTSVLWDAGQPTFSPPVEIENAITILSRVISRPGSDLLCLDLGHKAVASEMTPPRAKFFGLEDAEQVMHSEEHLVIRTPIANQFSVGSVVYAIPFHVCPTVALHSEVWSVENGSARERWPVLGRARRLTI